MWVGDKVYFLSDRDGGVVSLFSYDTKSKKVDEVVKNTGLDIKYASAGGGAIVYEKFGTIYTVDLGSTSPKKVDIRVAGDFPGVRPRFERVGGRISNSAISPTGARAVFEARGEIISAPADKGDPRNLTNTVGAMEREPHWSPDGRWIAFDVHGKDGRWYINLVEASGGQARQLTTGPFSSLVPTWSRDGKWIYFVSDRSGRAEVWRLPFPGGAAEQVTRDGGYVASESVDGRTLYYTKNSANGPLFSRLLGGGDEKQVLDNVALRGFAVFQEGIYYLSSRSSTEGEIRFHEFATGRSRLVSSIEGRLSIYLSVSPDRKTFLFTLTARREAT